MPLAHRTLRKIAKKHKLKFNDFIPLLFVFAMAGVIIFLVGNL